jgi:hypothetical protein
MRVAFIAAALAGSLVATTAMAQTEVERGETVTGRARPDYDPLGIRLGSFLLYPQLGVQETYDSNIFATTNNAKSDFITSFDPSLDLRSNWNNHALNFHIDSHSALFSRFSNENVNDYNLAANGRLDIMRDARLIGDAGYKVAHEARYSPEDVGTINPVEYSDAAAKLTGEKEFNRISFQLLGAFDRFEYQNGKTVAGAFVNEAIRNYDQSQVQIKTGYELAPQRQVYLLANYNWRDYQSPVDAGGFNRNSTGYTLAVGARYDLTGIVFADLFIGYRNQDYKDARLATASGITGGGKLTWNVTRLTTLTGEFTHDVQETTVGTASSYFASRAVVNADHELLRNLLLNANLGFERDDFQGITRADDYFVAGLGAKYLLNRNLWFSGGYGYRTRSSNAAGNDFDEHLVFIRLSTQL